MTAMIKLKAIKMLADMTSIMTQALIIMTAFIVFAADRRSFLMRLNIKIVSTDFRVKQVQQEDVDALFTHNANQRQSFPRCKRCAILFSNQEIQQLSSDSSNILFAFLYALHWLHSLSYSFFCIVLLFYRFRHSLLTLWLALLPSLHYLISFFLIIESFVFHCF